MKMSFVVVILLVVLAITTNNAHAQSSCFGLRQRTDDDVQNVIKEFESCVKSAPGLETVTDQKSYIKQQSAITDCCDQNSIEKLFSCACTDSARGALYLPNRIQLLVQCKVDEQSYVPISHILGSSCLEEISSPECIDSSTSQLIIDTTLNCTNSGKPAAECCSSVLPKCLCSGSPLVKDVISACGISGSDVRQACGNTLNMLGI